MLSKPKSGWTTLKIQDFEFNASYLTDVPNDFLNAFIVSLRDDISTSIVLDGEAEGECIVIFNTYSNSIYVVYDDYYSQDKNCIRFWDIDIATLAKEFVKDIEDNLNDWNWWLCDDESNRIDLETLKNLLK